MGLINWIFDIYQHSEIDKVRAEASQARREVAHLRGAGGGVDAERLERAIGELALATKALQRVLVEKQVCSGEEFAQRLHQIDLEDGSADGRAPLT
ncbi:MAG: hypothetical protein QF903_00890 [Planctomycetota bacterium]|jgi:hypothetical protein|nr:hypothetical protein [Planctomycetota bacterium]MDP6761422.1 hypothetical protein [Planctomycetota bacterium]MDP6988017.1 hypothetical protein [Planctomycetota bacterium]